MRTEDAPYVALLISMKNNSDTQLVLFHLSLPMGYIDSAPIFLLRNGDSHGSCQ